MMLCRTVELPENSSSLRKRETRRSRIKPLYYSKDLLLLDTMVWNSSLVLQNTAHFHKVLDQEIPRAFQYQQWNISQQFVQARNHHLTIFLLLVLSFARSSRGPLPCTPCVLQGGWWGNTHGGPRIDCERAREKWEVRSSWRETTALNWELRNVFFGTYSENTTSSKWKQSQMYTTVFVA